MALDPPTPRRRTLPRWRVVLTLAAPTEEDVIRALRSLLRQIGRAWGLRCAAVSMHVEPDHGAKTDAVEAPQSRADAIRADTMAEAPAPLSVEMARNGGHREGTGAGVGSSGGGEAEGAKATRSIRSFEL